MDHFSDKLLRTQGCRYCNDSMCRNRIQGMWRANNKGCPRMVNCRLTLHYVCPRVLWLLHNTYSLSVLVSRQLSPTHPIRPRPWSNFARSSTQKLAHSWIIWIYIKNRYVRFLFAVLFFIRTQSQIEEHFRTHNARLLRVYQRYWGALPTSLHSANLHLVPRDPRLHWAACVIVYDHHLLQWLRSSCSRPLVPMGRGRSPHINEWEWVHRFLGYVLIINTC